MAKSDEARAREHRLAAKLRENLRRRKQPAKDGQGGAPASPPAAGKPPRNKDGA